MRTDIPWKPNTTGAPDPFFMPPRAYLEALNGLTPDPDAMSLSEVMTTSISPYLTDTRQTITFRRRRKPFDPDAFHAVTGYIVSKRERQP